MSGHATGRIRTLLRIEGLALFVAATIAYFAFSRAPWWLYVALFLAPDLALIVYAVNRRVGVIVYDAAHTLLGPLILLTIGILASEALPALLASIWLAHIGIDRALGYGLRYPNRPDLTHLGPVGPLKRTGAA